MRGPRAALAAIVALLAAAVVWNAATYPPGRGYDAFWHTAYVEGLRDLELPTEGEYYTPPGFYTAALATVWLGERAGLGEPRRVTQLLNGALLVGTALLLLLLARTLFPGREVLHVAAVGGLALGAWAAKAAAMFHPETLNLFLCTLALLLVTRMLVARRFAVAPALLLGLVLGLAQLVRAFSLWTVAVALFGLLAAALYARGPRGAPLRAAAVAVGASLVLAGPWYLRQTLEFQDPIFAPPAPQEPLWERRPPSFYLDPGLPEVVTAPHRPNYVNRFWPQLYSDAWGDWFGFFAWDAQEGPPDEGERRRLAAQSVLGLLPTGLALAGWIALLWAAFARRRAELVPAALLPLAGIAGMLYFTVSYPTPDGDTIKAQYMLTTAPAWALAFGWGVDRLWRGRGARLALAAWLVPAALVSWAFSLYGIP